MTILAGRPSAPSRPSKPSRPAPKIYIPPPVQHVAVVHPAAPPPRAAPTNLRTGATPRGTAIPTHAPRPTVNDRAARARAPVGGSDITSSGAGYGSARANKFKASPAYKAAIIDVFNHQPDRVKGTILHNAVRNPSLEGDTIIKYLRSQVNPGLRLNLGAGTGKAEGPGQSIGRMLSNVVGAGEHAALSLTGPTEKALSGQAGSSAEAGVGPGGKLAQLAVSVPADIVRAGLESPATIPKTVTGLGETALGVLPALAGLAKNTVTEGPGKAFSDVFHGMARDYSHRYQPLLEGHDRTFINRLKKQGASSEVLDILGVLGGLDATAGRAVTSVARTGEEITGKPVLGGFLTRERPGLRTAGGEVRPQELARGAGRIAAQRVEDRLRAIKEARRPGEIAPRVGEVRPLFGNRSQRVLTSFVASKHRRLMQDTLDREVRQGAERSLKRMSPAERRAAPVALTGTVPLERGAGAARDWLNARIASIRSHRLDHPDSPGNHIPPEFASRVDETQTLQWMHDNVEKWLTPRLRAFVKAEGKRTVRIERGVPDSYMTQPIAEARRLAEQGHALGIEHPDETNARLAGAEEVAGRGAPASRMPFGAELGRARKISAAAADAERFQNFAEGRPGLLKDYSDRVRAAAHEHGLPSEPSYFMHRDVPAEHLREYTSGMGHRAMPATKRSTFALLKGGAIHRDPQVYLEGLARAIKVGHQWPLVDEQLRRNALPEPSAAAIKAAGFGKRRADTLTLREYTRAMMFDGHRIDNLHFYNPGRLRQSTLEGRGLERASFASRAGGAPPELESSELMHDTLGQDSVAGKRVDSLNEDEPFAKTTGWKALPPAAYKEIHSSLQPSNLGGRALGKLQGGAAAMILGGSPSFLVMNTLAHMVLATFGTRGRLLSDMVKAPLWYRGLSDAEKAIVDSHAGGRGRFHAERLGSTAPNRLAASWRQLKAAGIGRYTVGSVASHLNPIQAMFRAEDLQSNFFRRVVYYHAAKRAALDSMAKDMGLAANAANRLNHVFTLGPKARMVAQIANMHTAEELGRHTVNMMGDYTRFTHRERTWLNNRGILFYSFLRHAARTLFYVLPLHHPLATALTGELAKLHNDEVKKLLGGADLPYAYSRLFFDKGGKLSSIDFARSSPVGAASTDIPTEGLAGAAGLIPPELQPVLNAIYKTTPTGGPYQGNVWSLLNSFASMSYPYRLAQDLHFGTKLQQADSIPFLHERPQTKKTAVAKAYQAAKEQALGPNEQRMLASLFGLYPKPDDIRVIAQRLNKLKKGAGSSSAGSPAGWGPATSAASGSPSDWGPAAGSTAGSTAGWGP